MAKEQTVSVKASSRAIRCRDAEIIIRMMLDSWAAKTAAAASKIPRAQDGNRSVVDESRWRDVWDGTVPSWSGGGAGVEDAVVLRKDSLKGLTSVRAAYDAAQTAAAKAVAYFEANSAKPKTAVQVKNGGKWVRKLRTWTASKLSPKVMVSELRYARVAMEAAALGGKNRRMGRQRISTTSRKNIPVGQFLFGGRTALRMPPGRPALPREVWLARYYARKNRRQQKNATAIRRNRGTVAVPATRWERPEQVQLLGPKR